MFAFSRLKRVFRDPDGQPTHSSRPLSQSNIRLPYHSPVNFHQPDSFIPERFLHDHDAIFENDNQAVLQPFAVGPRNRIGRNLAYVEMRFILSKVIFIFDLELDEARCSDWPDQKIFSLWEKGPFCVKLKPTEFSHSL